MSVKQVLESLSTRKGLRVQARYIRSGRKRIRGDHRVLLCTDIQVEHLEIHHLWVDVDPKHWEAFRGKTGRLFKFKADIYEYQKQDGDERFSFHNIRHVRLLSPRARPLSHRPVCEAHGCRRSASFRFFFIDVVVEMASGLVMLSDPIWDMLRRKSLYCGEDRPYLLRNRQNEFIGVGPGPHWTNPHELPTCIRGFSFHTPFSPQGIREVFFEKQAAVSSFGLVTKQTNLCMMDV